MIVDWISSSDPIPLPLPFLWGGVLGPKGRRTGSDTLLVEIGSWLGMELLVSVFLLVLFFPRVRLPWHLVSRSVLSLTFEGVSATFGFFGRGWLPDLSPGYRDMDEHLMPFLPLCVSPYPPIFSPPPPQKARLSSSIDVVVVVVESWKMVRVGREI